MTKRPTMGQLAGRRPAPAVAQTTVTQHKSLEFEATQFTGPIPPPEIIERYQQIIPDAGNRILAMAEKQQTHRHGLEWRSVGQNNARAWCGMIFAFILGMTGMGGALWLISIGKSTEGFSAIILDLTYLIGVFLLNRKAQAGQFKAKLAAVDKPKP